MTSRFQHETSWKGCKSLAEIGDGVPHNQRSTMQHRFGEEVEVILVGARRVVVEEALGEDGLAEALLDIVAGAEEDSAALPTRVLSLAGLGSDEDSVALHDKVVACMLRAGVSGHQAKETALLTGRVQLIVNIAGSQRSHDCPEVVVDHELL